MNTGDQPPSELLGRVAPRAPRQSVPTADCRGNSHKVARHDRLIGTEAGHYFPHDLGDQCWCGADHGLPFSSTDGTIKTIFCPACTAKAFPPGVGRVSRIGSIERVPALINSNVHAQPTSQKERGNNGR